MTTTTDDMTTGERRISTPGAIRRLRDDWPLASLSAPSIGLLAVLGAVLFHGGHRAAWRSLWRRGHFDPEEGVHRIRSRIGRYTDVSEVEFSGSLTEEEMEDLAVSLGDINGNHLRSRLKSHVGRPRDNRQPEGVITGSYTEAEAAEWLRVGKDIETAAKDPAEDEPGGE